MSIFSSLLAIVATARLIPQDIRRPDRLHDFGKGRPPLRIFTWQTFWRLATARDQHRSDERAVRGRSLRARADRAQRNAAPDEPRRANS